MNLVADYQTAFRDYRSACEGLDMLAHTLKQIARNIEQYPGETCFAPFDGEPQPPLDSLMPGRRWEADRFPSAAQLQAAIRLRYETRVALYELWEVLPADQKIGLSPPPR